MILQHAQPEQAPSWVILSLFTLTLRCWLELYLLQHLSMRLARTSWGTGRWKRTTWKSLKLFARSTSTWISMELGKYSLIFSISSHNRQVNYWTIDVHHSGRFEHAWAYSELVNKVTLLKVFVRQCSNSESGTQMPALEIWRAFCSMREIWMSHGKYFKKSD